MKSLYVRCANMVYGSVLFGSLLQCGLSLVLILAGLYVTPGISLSVSLILSAGIILILIFMGMISSLLDRISCRNFLIVLFFLAFMPRMAWITSADNVQISDFAIFHELACAVIEGKGYTLTGPVGQEDLDLYLGKDKKLPYTTANRAPGTVFLIALIYKVFGINPMYYKILNVLMGTASCFLIYFILHGAGIEPAGRRASALWSLYPGSIVASNLLCSEILFTFLLLVLMLFLQKFISCRGNALKIAAAAGLIGGLFSLTRPMFLILAVALSGWGMISRPGLRKGIAGGIVFLFVFIVVLTPWSIRNYRLFGRLIIVCSSLGDFLARHTARNILGKIETTPEWRERWEEWRSITNEAEKDRLGYEMAICNLRFAAGKGLGNCCMMITRGLYELFGKDNDVINFSIARSQFFDPQKKWAFSDSTVGLLHMVNWAYYSAVMLLCFFGIPVKYHLFSPPEKDHPFRRSALVFLEFYFMLAVLAHTITPGINRYHFSLMVYAVISAGIFLIHVKDAHRCRETSVC